MSFTYVKIPANSETPIQELAACTASGKEFDQLASHAKSYYQLHSEGDRPSCEIKELTIPTAGNGFMAVSLYSNSYPDPDLATNDRATQLVRACGHFLFRPIRGDVFVGRAHDNKSSNDSWQRVDFTKGDADPSSEWCRTARESGGGGGRGGSVSSSLSGIVQPQLC